MGLIYKATSPSGKIYIGKTMKTLEERRSRHFQQINDYDTKFYRALRKYGFENFKWEVVEDNISELLIDQKEIEYIDFFNSLNKGYNSTIGGTGGDILSHLSEEKYKKYQQKMSKIKKGHPVSQRCIDVTGARYRGKKFSEEYREKISKATKQAMQRPEVKQKHLLAINSPEAKLKRSIAKQRRLENKNKGV